MALAQIGRKSFSAVCAGRRLGTTTTLQELICCDTLRRRLGAKTIVARLTVNRLTRLQRSLCDKSQVWILAGIGSAIFRGGKAVSQIISLEDHRRKINQHNECSAIVLKSVDGDLIECVNVDALSVIEQQKFLSRK
jgi:hypothetical protein